jgi:predicted DNA-binding transcriptional regulator AlpA
MKQLTEKDLATRWSVTTRTLQGWRKTGAGPKFIRIGERSIFYRAADVEAYEAAHVVGREEVWRAPVKRAAGAFDVLSKGAKMARQKAMLANLRDELRALLEQ